MSAYIVALCSGGFFQKFPNCFCHPFKKVFFFVIHFFLKFIFEIGFFKLAKVTFVHLWCFCLNCFLNMKFRGLKELFIMFFLSKLFHLNNGIKVTVILICFEMQRFRQKYHNVCPYRSYQTTKTLICK